MARMLEFVNVDMCFVQIILQNKCARKKLCTNVMYPGSFQENNEERVRMCITTNLKQNNL